MLLDALYCILCKTLNLFLKIKACNYENMSQREKNLFQHAHIKFFFIFQYCFMYVYSVAAVVICIKVIFILLYSTLHFNEC